MPLPVQPCASPSQPGAQGDFDLLLREERPRDRGAQQILVLVDPACPYQLPQVFGDELLAHVLDVDFRGACLQGFLFEAGKLVGALADIAANGDHLAAVIFLKPGNDDRGIQPARIRQGDFLRFVHIEVIIPAS